MPANIQNRSKSCQMNVNEKKLYTNGGVILIIVRMGNNSSLNNEQYNTIRE